MIENGEPKKVNCTPKSGHGEIEKSKIMDISFYKRLKKWTLLEKTVKKLYNRINNKEELICQNGLYLNLRQRSFENSD